MDGPHWQSGRSLQPLVTVERCPGDALVAELDRRLVPALPWGEVYGQFVDVHGFVPGLPADRAWEYLHDIEHLTDWTLSVRGLEQLPDLAGCRRYRAADVFSPEGTIYLLERKHPAVRTVEWWVGHSSEDLWMYYFVRVHPAEQVFGRPGAVLTWVNFGHENFQRNENLRRGFGLMPVAHGLECANLEKVLADLARPGVPSAGPIHQRLGLVTIENHSAEDILNRIVVGVRPEVECPEWFKDFVNGHTLLPNVRPERTWAYLSRPENLAEWTVSLRGVERLGERDGGRTVLFRAHDDFFPASPVYGELRLDPASSTVDLQLGSAPEDLWASHAFRVLDGQLTAGVAGSAVTWVAFHNEMHDTVGAGLWRRQPALTRLSVQNLQTILCGGK